MLHCIILNTNVDYHMGEWSVGSFTYNIITVIGNDCASVPCRLFLLPSRPQPNIYKQKLTAMLQRELFLLNSVLKQNLWVPGELTLDSLCFSCPDGQTSNTAYESDFHWLKKILFDIIDRSKHTKYLAWILTPSLLVDLAIVVFWQESVDVPHLCWRSKTLTRGRALIVHARKIMRHQSENGWVWVDGHGWVHRARFSSIRSRRKNLSPKGSEKQGKVQHLLPATAMV